MTQPQADYRPEWEKALRKILDNQQIRFADIEGKWNEFIAGLTAGPSSLTPDAFSLQLAISRHLLELMKEEVSDAAREALEAFLAPTDEKYKAATTELKQKLADEDEGVPLWYLHRGPKELTKEAHPELWDFYFGKNADFTPEESAELNTVATQVCDDAEATFSELLQYWKELVVNVELGYDNSPDEYEVDVWHSRGNLEQIALEIEGPLADKLKAVLEPWDARFKQATRDNIPERDEEDQDDETPAFLHRIPRTFRLSEDEQQEWMDL